MPSEEKKPERHWLTSAMSECSRKSLGGFTLCVATMKSIPCFSSYFTCCRYLASILVAREARITRWFS